MTKRPVSVTLLRIATNRWRCLALSHSTPHHAAVVMASGFLYLNIARLPCTLLIGVQVCFNTVCCVKYRKILASGLLTKMGDITSFFLPLSFIITIILPFMFSTGEKKKIMGVNLNCVLKLFRWGFPCDGWGERILLVCAWVWWQREVTGFLTKHARFLFLCILKWDLKWETFSTWYTFLY